MTLGAARQGRATMHNDPEENYNFDGKDYGPIHLMLDDEDKLRPCPFCGERAGLKLENVNGPHYWIECPCSARVDGDAVPYGNEKGAHSMPKHREAGRSAIRNWNRRVAQSALAFLPDAT